MNIVGFFIRWSRKTVFQTCLYLLLVSILIMFFLDALREMQKYSSDETKDVSTRANCCPPLCPTPSLLKAKGQMQQLDMQASRINTALFLSVLQFKFSNCNCCLVFVEIFIKYSSGTDEQPSGCANADAYAPLPRTTELLHLWICSVPLRCY